ncbi:M20 family metallopeptidase [Citrobacter sp. Cpo090]|uniref:M20 family metallopeptidase n=1 Tax=Citrobacter TaxID=544 RepID=UPI0018839F11|nr:M20 family metallopeptidase [Citrobacter sp. Cpo090]MBF0034392.1 M20 family metallopeptidase [Citrobacter freundii]MBJ9836751.1 M20 family metallopeptidase [Citrobacter freundii]MDM2843134.1 M20 family metallopeptidase [Citrobacter sp. Cpo090]
MKSVVNYLQKHTDQIREDISDLVLAESPSTDKAAVDHCGDVLKAIFEKRLGIKAETENQAHYGNQLKFMLGKEGPQTTILGHFDTVWDKGILSLREEEGKWYGPGILDMKAGMVQSIWAVRALKELGLLNDKRIVFLCNSDEELGSPSSKEWITRNAIGSEQVLVVEPATTHGDLKIARKGTGRYRIAITGLAAHAGNNPGEGVSAIEEMAFQILKLRELNDPERGTTVNVGIVRGGTRVNVVADHAELEIDTRVENQSEAARIHDAITRLTPHLSGSQLRIEGGQTRPPMERSSASEQLFEKAQKIAEMLGITISAKSAGGGSDGNFTAALDIPTLDGLGATGAGIHALHEHILPENIITRTALVAGMMLNDINSDERT